MSDKNKSKDGKSQGGCCGTLLGCSVVLALILSFLLGFYFVPKLRENNWSFKASFISIDEFRNKLSEKISDWNYRYIRAKDKIEENTESIEENVEELKAAGTKAAGKVKKVIEPEILPGAEDTTLTPGLIED